MTRVLIHTHSPDPSVAMLRDRFPGIDVLGCSKNSELPARLNEFKPDVLYTINISSDAPFPREAVLASSAGWISNGGSGTDHINPWDPDRVTVTNAAGVAADMMAEYVLGAFLHFNLDVPGLMADQSARHWDSARMVRPLAGSTLLIVGLGATGRTVAERAKAFGMQVLGTRASARATPFCDEVFGADKLPGLWHRADYIAICTPRLPSTRGLVDRSAFSAMKADAVLVNVARGGVVDEAALLHALHSDRLRGAAFDVFGSEPLPPEDPIWAAPNLLITPHCSAVYEGWEAASFQMFARNLEAYLEGENLTNIVDPKRGY